MDSLLGAAQQAAIGMRLHRRKFMGLGATAIVAAALPRPSLAAGYPNRPVHIVIGFPPGGTLDSVSRLIGQRLGERLGQQFVIDSKPGAGSNIAAEYVLRAEPDGYTLLACTSTNTLNQSLYQHLDFNFSSEATAVASMMLTPAVMEVTPGLPVKSVAEFIAYAKARPGEINMASPGVGTFHHVAGELFMMMTGTKLVHIPYHGEAPALIDLLAGRVEVMFTLLPSSIMHIKAGALRALGVMTAKRIDELPDIPTVAETVPGYEATSWEGLISPRGVPADIVQSLNDGVVAALADPEMKRQMTALGGQVFPGSPADFGRFIAAETEKWRKVIQAANIQVE
jgi:tripartite-type tricarboxylate transporter receptor subunit TctC